MGARLRLLIVTIGAMLVVATFTYPLWRTPPDAEVQTDDLPQLLPELQDAFRALPRPVQASYRLLSQENPFQAASLVEARVTPPEPAIEDLPEIGNAVLVAEGTFGPILVTINDGRDLPPLAPVDLDSDDVRDPPAFGGLHPSSGQVLVYRFPDNRILFRIENLNVINGPDVRVILSEIVDPLTLEDFGRDFVDISPLRSNIGNMNYEIRLDNFGIFESVVIYDRRYDIVLSVAPLG